MKNSLIEMRINNLNIITKVLTIFAIALFSSLTASSQTISASPVNWLYPDGNYSATRYISIPSSRQNLDSFIIKWSSPFIAGDVQPLIGNIVNNPKIKSNFRWSPNEIASVIGDELILIEATGRKKKNTALPPFVKGISVLFDTLSPVIGGFTNVPLSMGLETIEFFNDRDSLGFAYLASFNHKFDTLSLLKRLAIDLRDFKPNLFASVKPLFGHQVGAYFSVYSTVNMTTPDTSLNTDYFRGLTAFNTGNTIYTYPLPDVGDNINSRVTLAPFINISQPSFDIVNDIPTLLLPCYPDKHTKEINNRFFIPTRADIPYLFAYNLQSGSISNSFTPIDLTSFLDTSDKRPIIKPYFVDIIDNSTNQSKFILVAEEYIGLDSSRGKPKLHLFSPNGNPITFPRDNISPSILGGLNHLWSVAIGNVDGGLNNELLPYYPNNRGNEIVVTQSSRNFVYPGNKLMVLRYNSGPRIPKPSPPNSRLFPFDTIATMQINGWVAAVNDIDSGADGKDEIFLVNGSTLLVLRMRDYTEFEFQIGIPLDTVFIMKFGNEFISNIAIADLEGDGKSDIIVVTWDSLYVIGSEIPGIIQILSPRQQNPPNQTYCIGDTVDIIWKNLIEGINRISIFFREYINGNPTNNLVAIRQGFINKGDTLGLKYVVDNLLSGKTGRFIIQSLRSNDFQDSSSLLTFNPPTLLPQPLNRSIYPASSWITLQGLAECIESVTAVYSIDGSQWLTLENQSVNFVGNNYTIIGQLPCVIFSDCHNQNEIPILIGIQAEKLPYSNIFNLGTISLTPAILPIVYYENQTSCPSKVFKWLLSPLTITCDTVEILFSIDGGNAYHTLDKVPASAGEYIWQIPTNMPNEVNLRFCCKNTCYRTDTLFIDYKPTYISIVAPNPFNPPFETLEVIYEVPDEVYVTIRIYDAANRLVAEPVSNISRKPGLAYCDRWNGDTFIGTTASNGLYYLSLEMSNGVKEIYHIFIRK